jgi:hypothetical protein
VPQGESARTGAPPQLPALTVAALVFLTACGGQTASSGGEDNSTNTYCATADGYRFDRATGQVVPDPANPDSGEILDPETCNKYIVANPNDNDGHSSVVLFRTFTGGSHSSYVPGNRVKGGKTFGLTNSAARSAAGIPATGRISTAGGKTGGFAAGRTAGKGSVGGGHAGGGKAGGGHGGG